MWQSQVHPCLSLGSLSWWVPLCSCGPSAGPWFPNIARLKLLKQTKSETSQQSYPCGPSSLHCFVVRCTGWGACHWETSSQQPQVTASGCTPCHLLSTLSFPQKWSEIKICSTKRFSVLCWELRAATKRGREKGGKWKRKLLMSLNHERLGLGLEWFGIQGSLVLWLRG